MVFWSKLKCAQLGTFETKYGRLYENRPDSFDMRLCIDNTGHTDTLTTPDFRNDMIPKHLVDEMTKCKNTLATLNTDCSCQRRDVPDLSS